MMDINDIYNINDIYWWQALVDLKGGAVRDAPGVKILSISCSFWENLAK